MGEPTLFDVLVVVVAKGDPSLLDGSFERLFFKKPSVGIKSAWGVCAHRVA